jgi:hypothetical protein
MLPALENRPFAPSILKELTAIRTGAVADKHGWMVKI